MIMPCIVLHCTRYCPSTVFACCIAALVACLKYNQSCSPGQVLLIQALGCAHGPESTIPALVSKTDSILIKNALPPTLAPSRGQVTVVLYAIGVKLPAPSMQHTQTLFFGGPIAAREKASSTCSCSFRQNTTAGDTNARPAAKNERK